MKLAKAILLLSGVVNSIEVPDSKAEESGTSVYSVDNAENPATSVDDDELPIPRDPNAEFDLPEDRNLQLNILDALSGGLMSQTAQVLGQLNPFSPTSIYTQNLANAINNTRSLGFPGQQPLMQYPMQSLQNFNNMYNSNFRPGPGNGYNGPRGGGGGGFNGGGNGGGRYNGGGFNGGGGGGGGNRGPGGRRNRRRLQQKDQETDSSRRLQAPYGPGQPINAAPRNGRISRGFSPSRVPNNGGPDGYFENQARPTQGQPMYNNNMNNNRYQPQQPPNYQTSRYNSATPQLQPVPTNNSPREYVNRYQNNYYNAPPTEPTTRLQQQQQQQAPGNNGGYSSYRRW